MMRWAMSVAAVVAMLSVGLGQEKKPSATAFSTCAQATSTKASVRVFHIGNSLTAGVLTGKSVEFLSDRGTKYEYGWHILWSSSLADIWEKEAQPSVKTDKYGTFKTALPDFSWDVLTLQPWGANLQSDVDLARKFIELSLTKSPEIQVYIYETWPSKEEDGKPSFAQKWARPLLKGVRDVGTYNSTYCKLLVEELNKALPDLKKPVRLIPVGSVMSELDGQARAGKVPGLAKVEDAYADWVHLNAVGKYMSRCAFYAVIMKDDPRGLPASALFKDVSDETAAVIQEAVWKVVTSEELTGVKDAGAATRPVGVPTSRKK